jgi:bifunctional DNA-binding transcriptional regulator/antitoxin component of YhaV-PrlF toxin-antitoxin module
MRVVARNRKNRLGGQGKRSLPERGNVAAVAIAQSKVTARGLTSVPAEVRRRLGTGPGSVIEWDEQDGSVIVWRAGRFSSADMHEAVFSRGTAKQKRVPDVVAGIRKCIWQRCARDDSSAR